MPGSTKRELTSEDDQQHEDHKEDRGCNAEILRSG